MHADEVSGTLLERAGDLRQTSPAAYLAVVTQVDLLEAEGVAHDAALERALRALGR